MGWLNNGLRAETVLAASTAPIGLTVLEAYEASTALISLTVLSASTAPIRLTVLAASEASTALISLTVLSASTASMGLTVLADSEALATSGASIGLTVWQLLKFQQP